MARCLITLFVLAAVLATGASGATSATAVVYRDTTGENLAGPDITTVNVWSDGHELAFRFPIPTSPVVTPDMRIRVWLDADDSLETGLTFESGPTGFDHFIVVDPTRFRPDEARLYSCAGTTCFGAPSSSLTFTYSSGATFTIDAPDLGLKRVSRVRFSVSVWVGIGLGPDGYDFTNARLDIAPDAPEEGLVPMWTFDAQPLEVTAFRTAPSSPRAGEQFTLRMSVRRSDTDAAITRGKATCSLLVAGKPVPAGTSRLVGGLATCAFEVPAATKGRRYRATVAVAAEGSTVVRSVSGRVR